MCHSPGVWLNLKGKSARGMSVLPEIVTFFLRKVVLILGPSALDPGDFPKAFGEVVTKCGVVVEPPVVVVLIYLGMFGEPVVEILYSQ